MTRAVLFIFLASLGLDWPPLPGNARLPELLVGPAVLVVLINRGGGLRARPLDLAVIAYVVAGAIGLVASSDRAASLVELARHGYLAGIYALVALAVTRGFGSTIRAGFAAMGVTLAVPALCFALVFLVRPVAIPAAGEIMKMPYAGELLRLRAFTASPTMFACVLTMAMPFAIAGWVQAADGRARWTWAAAIALMSVALLMTFSHAWAGAALAATIATWPLLTARRMLRAASIAAVVILTLVFNASLVASVRSVFVGDRAVVDQTRYPYAMDEGKARLGAYTVEYAVMSYFRTKQLALEAFVEHPFTGVGLDRFHDVTAAAYRDGRLTYGYREIDPHSSLLGRLAETGIVGGLTLVGLWVGVLLLGIRLAASGTANAWLARAALAGFAGLLLAGVNVDIMNFRFLWAGFGVLRGLSEPNA